MDCIVNLQYIMLKLQNISNRICWIKLQNLYYNIAKQIADRCLVNYNKCFVIFLNGVKMNRVVNLQNRVL